jgi:hypothetical protein
MNVFVTTPRKVNNNIFIFAKLFSKFDGVCYSKKSILLLAFFYIFLANIFPFIEDIAEGYHDSMHKDKPLINNNATSCSDLLKDHCSN